MMKLDEVLSTWVTLNQVLPRCSEQCAKDLLDAELSGRRRQQFLLRIHSRYNRMRAGRERKELRAEAKR